MGRWLGQIGADDLPGLVESPNASVYFDARSGNINVIQTVDGKLLRISTAADDFRIISVGPIQLRNVTNNVANGNFVPIFLPGG